MLAHISLSVKDFHKSKIFYDESLSILGYQRVVDSEDPFTQVLWAGYGQEHHARFWITSGGKAEEQVGSARGFHICFHAPSIEKTQEWHKKCLELGGTDNGAPGKRIEYDPNYYSAFIIDPNGWRLEAFVSLADW